MVSSLLRIASLLCIGAVLVSFGAFVNDQAGASSDQTVAKIDHADSVEYAPTLSPTTGSSGPNLNEASPTPRVERLREKEHGSIREHVDDVNDTLTAPFSGAATSDNIWARRILQGLLAIAVFGVGLGFLGRYAATRGI